MTKPIWIIAATALAISAGAAIAADAPPPARPADAPKIGPWANPALPIGGYVKAPAGSTRLVEKVFEPAEGFPLYTLDRECRGQCAVEFPPLTPKSKDERPPGKDWSIRIRDENGDPQWVYKGKPVYTFIDDTPDKHPMADQVIPGVALLKP